MSSIDERVKKIVAEQLGVKEEEVQTEASFVEDLGADSLDTVELVMALEEEFETEIPDEEAEKITTVKLAITLHKTSPDLLSSFPGKAVSILIERLFSFMLASVCSTNIPPCKELTC